MKKDISGEIAELRSALKGEMLGVCVTSSFMDRVKAVCKRLGLKKSAFARIALERALCQFENKKGSQHEKSNDTPDPSPRSLRKR